jgi:HK97 family phage portal protein
VQIAVSAVAQSAAVVPMQIKQLQNEQTEAIVNHPFETLMRRPNPLQSRFEFLEAHHSYKLISGNSYWYLSRTSETAPPTELWMIPPHQIVPVPDGRSFIRGYLYDPGYGQKIPLEPWEVCHFKTFNPLNKFLGLSPMQALMIAATGDIAAQQFSANFYSRDNAKIAGILAFADPINDSDWKMMRDDMRREHGDGKNRIMRLRNSGKSGLARSSPKPKCNT